MDQKTYIHRGIEVIMTGRTAVRETRKNKQDTLYEIKPYDIEDGSTCEWVRIKDIHEVNIGTENSNDSSSNS